MSVIGKTYGSLTVIKHTNGVRYECLCSCGTRCERSIQGMRSGTHHCGCQNKPREKRIKNIKGRKYGRLLVLEFVDLQPEGKTKWPCARWLCQCDCGKKITTFGTRLRSESPKSMIRSCGCLKVESAIRAQRLAVQAIRKSPTHRSLKHLIWDYRGGAKRRGLRFLLSEQDIFNIATKPCHYCGTLPGKGPYMMFNGLDRRNNHHGYTIHNTVPCCSICNRAKSDLAERQFKDWIRQAFRHQNRDN
jgi:hypothetical protein